MGFSKVMLDQPPFTTGQPVAASCQPVISPSCVWIFHSAGTRQPPTGSSSNQYTSTPRTVSSPGRITSTHSSVPLCGQNVQRFWRLSYAAPSFGRTPSKSDAVDPSGWM